MDCLVQNTVRVMDRRISSRRTQICLYAYIHTYCVGFERNPEPTSTYLMERTFCVDAICSQLISFG